MPGVFFLIFITTCFVIPISTLLLASECYLFDNCIIIDQVFKNENILDEIWKIPIVFGVVLFLLF